MDEDLYAEIDAVSGTYQEGFEDGWYSRRKNMKPYDKEAYEQGYGDGSTAARQTFYQI